MFRKKSNNPMTATKNKWSPVQHDYVIKDNNLVKQPASKKVKFFKLKWPPNKKEWTTSFLVVVFGGFIIAYVINHSGPKPVVNATSIHPKVKVKPKTTEPSLLTGLEVPFATNKIPVTGVMIENSVPARPQSGLSQAGVVFEAIAEGGITRFLALFQDTSPPNVGPIRSVRPYYEKWALGFDASIAHVGGSPEALADMKAWNVKDLDQFQNSGAYSRISTRAAPHNVYTSIARLNAVETAKNYTTVNFKGFPRKLAKPLKVPTASNLDMTFTQPDYAVHFQYDPKTNTYLRSEGGTAHIDQNTNTQISPAVVIAMVIPYSLEADHYHSDYGVIGSGQAYIFQDGGVTIGQWTKTSSTDQISFVDAKGVTIKLNPGQTWLTAIVGTGNIKYN